MIKLSMGYNIPPKPCKKCGLVKSQGERCAPCRKSYQATYAPIWRNGNIDNVRASSRKYRSSDKGKVQMATWIENNQERHRNIRCAVSSRRKARELNALGSHTAAEWDAVLRAYKHRCAQCGSTDKLERDHIIPLSRGGSDFIFNLQPLCVPCNRRKHNHIPADANFSLFDGPEEMR